MIDSRKLIRTTAVVLLWAVSSAAAPGDPGCEFDYDEDGFITQQDVQACSLLLEMVPPVYDEACDANGDEVLSAVDILQLLDLVGLDCTAPAPSVPSGSRPVWSLLVLALLFTSGLMVRFPSAGSTSR